VCFPALSLSGGSISDKFPIRINLSAIWSRSDLNGTHRGTLFGVRSLLCRLRNLLATRFLRDSGLNADGHKLSALLTHYRWRFRCTFQVH